jgi:hypothetical protein
MNVFDIVKHVMKIGIGYSIFSLKKIKELKFTNRMFYLAILENRRLLGMTIIKKYFNKEALIGNFFSEKPIYDYKTGIELSLPSINLVTNRNKIGLFDDLNNKIMIGHYLIQYNDLRLSFTYDCVDWIVQRGKFYYINIPRCAQAYIPSIIIVGTGITKVQFYSGFFHQVSCNKINCPDCIDCNTFSLTQYYLNANLVNFSCLKDIHVQTFFLDYSLKIYAQDIKHLYIRFQYNAGKNIRWYFDIPKKDKIIKGYFIHNKEHFNALDYSSGFFIPIHLN